jgi:flagellar hook assembly protein FlgD
MEHRIIRPGQGQPLKVTIALVRREKVLVSIYSRQGMLIKTLADSELDAGTHEFSWDGVTQNGRPTGSGIYVLVIRTDSLMENRKFVLIR